MKHILATPRRRDARKHEFRHHVSQIAPNFPPKTGLGCEIPSLGLADPWDGDGFPWDGSLGPPHGRTKKPQGYTKISLEGARRSLSALTLCHIAHGASRFLMAGLCPAGGPSMRGSAARLRPASGSRLSGPSTTGRRCPEGVFHRPPFCSNNMMRFSLF